MPNLKFSFDNSRLSQVNPSSQGILLGISQPLQRKYRVCGGFCCMFWIISLVLFLKKSYFPGNKIGLWIEPRAYSEPCQTAKTELFARRLPGFRIPLWKLVFVKSIFNLLRMSSRLNALGHKRLHLYYGKRFPGYEQGKDLLHQRRLKTKVVEIDF